MSHLIVAYGLVAALLVLYVARMGLQRWQLSCRYTQLIQLLEKPATADDRDPSRSRLVA